MKVKIARAMLILGLLVAAPRAIQDTPAGQPDLNLDGFVDHEDVLMLMTSWHAEVPTPTPVPPTATPVPTSTPVACTHPGEGTYLIEISGDDTGSGTLQTDAMGNVSGGVLTSVGELYVYGAASLDGQVHARYEYYGQPVGVVVGTMLGSSGGGWWWDIEGDYGTWTATKQ